MAMDKAYRKDRLRKVCDEVVGHPDYVKRDVTGDGVDETFCNLAFLRVAEEMGCPVPCRCGHPRGKHVKGACAGALGCKCRAHQPLMANDLVEYMKSSMEWRTVSALAAQRHAWDGGLAVAGRKGAEHGHVAVVHPDGGMVFSGNWKQEVPTVANVGKKNAVMGANFAFDKFPEFFIWEDPNA